MLHGYWTDSFVIYVETEDFYKVWWNYDENDKRPLLIGKNKRISGLFKDKLREKIMILFVGLRAKT